MHRVFLFVLLAAFSPALARADGGDAEAVTAPPAEWNLDPFYAKHVSVDGLPVVASSKVPDEALTKTAAIVRAMTRKRPDMVEQLIKNRVRVAVMAESEVTTDIPEHSDLTPASHWDRRARGLGATHARPAISCAEENVLGYPTDRYRGENILVHEFGHALHEMAIVDLDPKFDGRLQDAFEHAKGEGRWEKTYAAQNHKEYWAEGVQSWFNVNRESAEPNGVHNHVNTREELREYDPELFALVAEWLPEDAGPIEPTATETTAGAAE